MIVSNTDNCCTKSEVNGMKTLKYSSTNSFFLNRGLFVDNDYADTVLGFYRAIAMSFMTKDSHIPLPTRLADLETHTVRNAIQQSALKD